MAKFFRRIRKQKGIAGLLTLLILLQSCVVYQKSPSSLEEASQLRTQTKVTILNGTEIKFKFLSFEDGQYYGARKTSGELQRTLVKPENVRTVQVKNKKASTLATVGAVVVPVVAFVAIGRWIFNESGFDSGLEF